MSRLQPSTELPWSLRRSTGERLGRIWPISEQLNFGALRFHRELLPKGHRSSPPHRHSAREEVVYVLRGHPSVWQDGDRSRLSPGDVMGFAPGGGFHMVFNDSDDDVELLVASAVSGEDRVDFCPEDPWEPVEGDPSRSELPDDAQT